jgi:glucokinase
VFIAGGIVPRFENFFVNSRFRHFFEKKGRFSEYLQSIPTYLVSRPDLGLVGAAKKLMLNQG